MTHPLERILALGLRRLLQVGTLLVVVGLMVTLPGPENGLLSFSMAHLLVLQVATLAFAIELAPLTDRPWFSEWRRPWLASVASVVACVVGYSALLTLASSAALRYEPSFQFLQLLSSLDIAWVVSGLYLAVRSWGRHRVALVAGSALLIACVASILVYLLEVGFTPQGGWLVDGRAMITIVIPSDVMAAIITVSALLIASRRHATVQARPQS